MRICILYDCLFPWTVGGAERWYRNLAERLAADGHDVTSAELPAADKDAISHRGQALREIAPLVARVLSAP